MSDKTLSFGKHGEYSAGEISFVIENLAAMKTLEEVQALFFKFTVGQKELPGQVVQQIKLKYSDKIKKQNEIYIGYIDGNPLAHLRVRLDMYYRIYLDSMTPSPVRIIKRNDDENIVVSEPDRTSALNALKLARDDMAIQSKLKSEKQLNQEQETLSERVWKVE